jgi:hypothetical protein
MKDVIRQKTIKLLLRMHIGGPPLSRLMRGIVPQRGAKSLAIKRHKGTKNENQAASHISHENFSSFLPLGG